MNKFPSRRIVWWIILVGLTAIGNIFGGGEIVNEVFAQTGSVSESETALAANLQLIIRMIYLILWPMIAIVGATLDNSLVMGEVFFLNTSIYSMRQLMRNFANFALGGIFLYAILRNVFTAMSWSEEYISGERGVKKLLPKVLFAAILIQSSFFMMSVLIDLSTVAIYSVWTIPINSVINNEESNLNNVRFLQPDIKFSLDNTQAANGTDSTFGIFYGCSGDPDNLNYIPCEFNNNKLVPLWNKDGSQANTRYKHKKTEAEKRSNLTDKNVSEVTATISDDYCVYGNWLLDMRGYFGEEVNVCTIKKMREDVQHAQWGGVMAAKGCPTMGSFFENASGMTGPMYGLYASIFRMDQLALTENHKDTIEISLEFLVKLAVAIALVIPLIALAVAMVIRLVALRWFIIFSPMLALGRVFFSEKLKSQKEWKASFTSLLGLVFMPVLVVFAISFSLMFMTLISNSDQLSPEFEADQSFASRTWMQYKSWVSCSPDWTLISATGDPKDSSIYEHCYNLAGITSLCFTETQKTIGNSILNVFSYLLVNFFGVALMWMVVFTAMASSKITSSTTEAIKWFGQEVFKATRIPVAWWLSYNDIQNTRKEFQNMPGKISQEQWRNLSSVIDRFQKKNGATSTDFQKNLNKATTKDEINKVFDGGLPTQTSVEDLNNTYEKIWIAAGASWKISNLTDLAGTEEWLNWLRKYWDGNLWAWVQKLNNVTEKKDKIKIDNQMISEVQAWLQKQADTANSGFTKLWDGKYYHDSKKSNFKEFITVTASWIQNSNVSTIDEAMKSGLTTSLMSQYIADADKMWGKVALPAWMKAIGDKSKEKVEGKRIITNSDGVKSAINKTTTEINKSDLLVSFSSTGEITSIERWTK